MKRTTSILLALCLAALCLAPFALAGEAAANTQEFTCTTQLSHFIQEPSPSSEVRIGPAVLSTAGGDRDVYVLTICGIDWLARGSNNFSSYLSALFNRKSAYFDVVKRSVLENIPEGSAIVAYGHSLGGMMLQQIVCDGDLTEKYEFVNAVTFGSPYVGTDKSAREGTLVRLEDKSDIVPKISFASADSEVTRRGGNYGIDISGAHNVSYKRDDIWGSFDVLGVDGGSAKLTLDLDSLQNLQA